MDECDFAQIQEDANLKNELALQALRKEPPHTFCAGCNYSVKGQQMRGCDSYGECLADWQLRERAKKRNGTP